MRLLTRFLVLTYFICISSFSFGQSPSASIATWKSNYTGAYSVIHDDFGAGSVNGIENYADTIAFNRGIKFTFGAITSECTSQDWANALVMMSHGHEIMNHSHNHYCGQPVGWCETNTWDENDFDIEIDQSSSLIQSNTGHYPRFYIFPYDLHTDTMLSYLESVDYLGARAGTQSQTLNFANLNDQDFNDPFRVNFFVFGPSTNVSDLNAAAQMAIDNSGWAIRELHGVQDASWASVGESDYRAHMDFCKQKQDAGDLWCSTTSDIISYQTQRKSYSLNVSSNIPLGEITIDFTNNNPALKTNIQICPLTLNVDVDGMSGVFEVYQNGSQINDVSRIGDVITFNASPENGIVTLTSGGCPGQSVCITTHPTSQSVNQGQNIVFTADATSSVSPLTYQWQKDGSDLVGQTSSTLSVNNVQATDAGDYTCIISNGIESSTTNAATLTISSQTPYGGSLHIIPGRVECEEYDEGGQGISYSDSSPGNTGNVFRTDDVDIEATTDGGSGYNVGWTGTGEWLEYSVRVATSGTYTITFRTASDDFNAKRAMVEIDEVDVTGNVSIPNTGGWQSWTNVTVTGVSLTEGQHIMKLNITGVYNINYIDFTTTATDCNSDVGGAAYIDNCSQCVGGNTGNTACEMDCNNEWGGTAAIDGCGVCAGGSTGVIPDEDSDSDGTPDCNDLCPSDPNKIDPGTCGCGNSDLDTDSDGTPDCNDLCINDPDKTDPGTCGCGISDVDSDSDGTLDCNDLCPNDPNKVTPGTCGCGTEDTDSDSDGTLDCNDLCPNDPNKIAPGTCGCGVSDVDSDSDGTMDCNDQCPNDPNKIIPGSCGCGNFETDTDTDGTPDCIDLCPNDVNKTSPGACGCGQLEGTCTDCNGDAGGTAYQDVCGDCVGGNTGQSTMDTDNDGTPDCNDLCPSDPNKTTPGTCGCGTDDIDSDSDGTPDCNDLCPNDPSKLNPGTCGCGVTDLDSDSDGTPNCNDQCPNDNNKTLPGTCGCGVADTDSDSDGTPDCNDQCPSDPNKTIPGECGCGATETSCEDCNGDANGSASLDICGECTGGNTGVTPVTDIDDCVSATSDQLDTESLQVYPNPFTKGTNITLHSSSNENLILRITDVRGVVIQELQIQSNEEYQIGLDFDRGVYIGLIVANSGIKTFRIIKQ